MFSWCARRTLRFAWRRGNSVHPIGRLGNVAALIRCRQWRLGILRSGSNAHVSGVMWFMAWVLL